MASQEIVLRLVNEGQGGQSSSGSNPASSILGGVGAGMSSNSSALKMAGAGGLVTVIKAGIDVLKKIYGQLVESSTIMKGTNELFKMTWKLMWKPLGDFIGQLLKPLAIFLLKWVVNDLKEIAARKTFYAGMQKIADATTAKGDKITGAMLGGIAAIGSTGLLPIDIGFLASMLTVSLHDLGLAIKDIFFDVDATEYISPSILLLYASISDEIKKSFMPNTNVNDQPSVIKSKSSGSSGGGSSSSKSSGSSLNLGDVSGTKFGDLIGSKFGKAATPPLAQTKSLTQAIKNLTTPAKSSSSAINKLFKVKDGIITKDGKVIQTDPQDNIYAAKGPMGGTKIDNMNITITVQQLNSDRDLRDLAGKLSEYIQRKNTYRTAGGY